MLMTVHFSCCHLCAMGYTFHATQYSFCNPLRTIKVKESSRNLTWSFCAFTWVCLPSTAFIHGHVHCACASVYWHVYIYLCQYAIWKKQRKEKMNACVCGWTCKIGGLCECVMWLWDDLEPGGRWTTVNNISVPSLWPHRLCACAGLPLKNRGCIGPWGWISLSEAALLLLTPSLFL